MRECYDPNAVKDAIFFNAASQDAFIPVDEELFERIQARKFRL